MPGANTPPTSFPLPSDIARVNETFARLALDPDRMPTLHRLLVRGTECLLPMNDNTRAIHEQICKEKLASFRVSAGFALDNPQPYASKRADVREAFLCALAKPMIHSSHAMLGSLFQTGDAPDVGVLAEGNSLMLQGAIAHKDSPVLSRRTLESLMPEARYLVETQALFVCFQTVTGATSTAISGYGQREMEMLLARLQWYIPAMMDTRSQLGAAFRTMADTPALNDWRRAPADAAPAENRVVPLRRPASRQSGADSPTGATPG